MQAVFLLSSSGSTPAPPTLDPQPVCAYSLRQPTSAYVSVRIRYAYATHTLRICYAHATHTLRIRYAYAMHTHRKPDVCGWIVALDGAEVLRPVIPPDRIQPATFVIEPYGALMEP
jgi:hypothetical protein